jgi:hypothetical protein
LITVLFPSYFSKSIQLFGDQVPGPILAPTLYPVYFVTWLKVHSFFGWGGMLDSFWFRLVTLIIPNVSLYSLATYIVLWLFDFPKKKQAVGIHEPPPPLSDGAH